jgi:hypothetical protein
MTDMRISTGIHAVFGHFQNLNLLALMHDLRTSQTARQDWVSTGKLLCPVAHGLANGEQVKEVNLLGEFANLGKACTYAANCLGADLGPVLRFVRSWDDHSISTDVLLRHLEEIWEERLADAEAVQGVLTEDHPDPNRTGWTGFSGTGQGISIL